MSQIKRASKGKRSNKALTALSIAGVSLAATAASSAAVLVPMGATPAMPLGEEEISGVTLATFHLLDQEKAGVKDDLLQLTRGRGCGCGRGCRGCRGCGGRGCRGCGGGWGGGGCGDCGCGGGWCLSWGGCRPWC
jgi:hypothetical protein